jgi:methionine aminopeptidase
MQFKKYTESFGYGVVRELVGHGLAKKMHEDPKLNYVKRLLYWVAMTTRNQNIKQDKDLDNPDC